MAVKITREVLEGLLKCKHKGHLKLVGEQGSKTDCELLLNEARDRVCAAAAANLSARHKVGEVLRGVAVTPAVLKRGVPLLLDATLEDEHRCVHFDALQKADGLSALGDFHYVPVLFHEGEKPVKEQRGLLELLGLLLGAVQGRDPVTGVLLHGRGCEVRKLKLNPDGNRRLLEEIVELQAGGTAPRLVLNDHCQVCEFRQRCHAAATATDDLSLLRGMSEKEIAKCGRRGIFTVTQLSCTFRPRRKGTRSRQTGQPHHHSLQALAVRDKKVYVLGSPEWPTSPARIYFDIEGDPERNFVYLLGMIVEKEGAEERHSFWADSPTEESRLFEQFLAVVGRFKDVRVYAYGSYEAAFLRRMMKEVGKPELSEKLLARLVNVLSVVHSHVYFPVHRNGLKDVAGYLGFRWTASDASGIQSIVWRRRWEETGSAVLKETLTTYNLEDCAALKKVADYLHAVLTENPTGAGNPNHAGREVSRVETTRQGRMRGWNQSIYGVADFGYINDRASFDYQRDRVYIRTNKLLKKSHTRKRTRRWKKNRRVNREVELSSQSCPSCGRTELTRRQNRSLARLAFDLRITRSGIKGWVTRYRAAWHDCEGCGLRFLPADYLRLEEFCHSLKSWAMYEYVTHRTSLPSIADTLKECFNLPIGHPQVHAFKGLLAQHYEGTYKRLLEKIVAGPLVHADETEICVRRIGRAYVWVFTNLEEVVFVYRPSREGDFLHELLKDFKGVLVSDFYAAYDSLGCPQQKCLVHLLRDFNQDILANPWDEELKSIASDFGGLLRAVIATVDRYGLKQRHLGKHRRDVDRFFRTVSRTAYRSEAAEGYRARLLKCRDKLFTFLDRDGIPWNNNPAEHAIKRVAHYREVADSLVTESGLTQYLVLLSIQQTCKYKGVSFLKFLLSRETDVDGFRAGRRTAAAPAIELYPQGSESGRPSRKRLRMDAQADSSDEGRKRGGG